MFNKITNNIDNKLKSNNYDIFSSFYDKLNTVSLAYKVVASNYTVFNQVTSNQITYNYYSLLY